ncbi:MAG TPA: glycosyltransferase [Frateuria sp.]|uniref:glycosyltransferase n=1 Tax=Frateuria sp. TaxID=2211372 RepID=UPI002DEFFA24|nr:glycosyltransferase [Frateuria sp.]
MPTPTTPSPLISVALSAYNGERFLRAQLDSILAQRDVQLEIIAVDDGSRDASVALLQDYARRDERVRVHPNPANLGPTRSFERAMSLCRGEFIAPSDQDDLWAPNKLATLLAAIGQADLAYCDSAYIDPEGQPSGRRISDDTQMLAGCEPLRFAFANSVSGHALLVRRDLFESARPLPPELFYDWVLAMFAAARGGVVYVHRPLVQFRRHTQAYSSLGREGVARKPDRYRGWITDRVALLRALAGSRFDAAGRARRMSEALELAIDKRSHAPLLRAIWRERMALAEPGRPAWQTAVRLQMRMLRKLARARREAAG